TAADRPYKTPKTLNEALGIMSMMRDEGHIDAELFDLFLQSGVYRAYGERYLDPAQVDAVDLDVYLSAGRS
ncbi:MAG: diguanylate cyclase, partial [Desulfobacteraceae bacterium]